MIQAREPLSNGREDRPEQLSSGYTAVALAPPFN